MKYLSKGIMYHGICETLSGKAIFMEEALRIEKVQEEVAKYLASNAELREKIGYISTPVRKGTIVQLSLYEEDLEIIFDEMCGKNTVKYLKDADELKKFYAAPCMEKERKIECDITGYVLCAIVMNSECRKKIKEKIKERGEYYGFWEKEHEKYSGFETCIPAQYIWDFRLLTGIVEKFRTEEYKGGTYHLFMEIVYSGYGYLKRIIKGEKYLTMLMIKDIFKEDTKRLNNMFPVKCWIVLALVIAEDMQIPLMIDYDFMVNVQFYEQKEKGELPELTSDENKEEVYEAEAGKKKNREFFEKFDEIHRWHHSLTELALSPEEEGIGDLLFKIMEMFGLNPRKFAECTLMESECDMILEKSDRWSKKKYEYILVIAGLCRYIQQLEEVYLKNTKNNIELNDWKVQQAVRCQEKKEEEYAQNLRRINEEKAGLSDIIREQEQQIMKLSKQVEEVEKKRQKEKQELGALRSYVYMTGKKEEQSGDISDDDEAEVIEFWKEKKVLVVGGHVNWQNKLRELFPGWQFITAGQNALVSAIIKGRDIIICNTAMLNHSCYYKLISEKNKSQKLLYAHSNNIRKCLMELNAQMA